MRDGGGTHGNWCCSGGQNIDLHGFVQDGTSGILYVGCTSFLYAELRCVWLTVYERHTFPMSSDASFREEYLGVIWG